MSRIKTTTTRLPISLEKELGLKLRPGPDKRDRFTARGPKEQRRADRIEKRKPTRGERQHAPFRRAAVDENGDEEDPDFEAVGRQAKAVATKTRVPTTSQPPQPKSILKKPRLPSPTPSTEHESVSSRASSPSLVLDANSKSYRDRLAQDEGEIEALEKKLGLKNNKKAGKDFDADGLGDLVDGLDSNDEDRKRKSEEREWLQRKRRRRDEPQAGTENKAVTDGGSDAAEGDGNLDSAFSDDDGDDKFSGFSDAEEEDSIPKQPTKVRENPYVPPMAPSPSTQKYVPPSLRRLQNGSDHSLDRLKRQIQGQLNKLSDANLVSILNEIENMYQSNARQDVTSALIDLLLSLFCDQAALQTTFVLLHAAFASAVYKVVGTDFGAELLARLVERFSHYHFDISSTGKESLNLISFLAHLFTFHLTSSTLIYSHINLLLSPLSENNTELLLRVIRDCGPQLRSDDPSALKSVVSRTQIAAQALPAPVSVRTQFMLETITDLKNNKMRDSTANSSMTREHITKLRKTLGSLNSRSLRATEPLRLTLDDLRNSDRKGKWWLVGASWKGNSPPPYPHNNPSAIPSQQPNAKINEAQEVLPDYPSLARHLSLTTPLQISILTAIASSSTATDGFVRLSKLRLKRAQEAEVSRVLLRCCGKEDSFNTYYFDLAKRLCAGENGKQWTKRFEFSFWGVMRRLGERGDEEGDGDEDGDVEMKEVFNVAKLYAHLIHSQTMSLSVLRPLDLLMLSEKGSMFVELLFVDIFALCKGKEEDVAKVFSRLSEAKQVVAQVRIFLKRVVKGSDFVGKKTKDKETLRRGVKNAVRVLEGLEVTGHE